MYQPGLLQGALPCFAACQEVPGVERQTTEQLVKKKFQPYSPLFV